MSLKRNGVLIYSVINYANVVLAASSLSMLLMRFLTRVFPWGLFLLKRGKWDLGAGPLPRLAASSLGRVERGHA